MEQLRDVLKLHQLSKKMNKQQRNERSQILADLAVNTDGRSFENKFRRRVKGIISVQLTIIVGKAVLGTGKNT